MAKQVAATLHDLSVAELQSKIGVLEHSVQEARLKLAAGKLDKPSQIRNEARELAQLKTVLRQKELAAVTA